ncbi:MAG: cytidylate kinase-like family protein [Prevotella sp.]|mgnify:FL=1|jgi:cytidylate kinase|nr:cytidylate kinase-like family protein [Prevotella sp.]MBQ2673946.1 cytidylate kinase-like family protein [Prevotella sp.]MBQ3360868.1 cytidylate kinase-like family protein [Prevotella sp.]
MNDNKHIIICVGRQLGSGGHDIARMLAADFNAKYYDQELLNLAAKESGFSEKFFEANDEQRGIFRSLFHLHASHVSDNNLYQNNFSQESLFKFQSDAIEKAANEGSCVFVGRCADYVLRNRDNVVNIFISASKRFRIEQIMAKQKLDFSAARKFMQQREGKRAAYYNYYTGKKWGAAESYDLCIDASILGLQATEKLIADFIRKRFEL